MNKNYYEVLEVSSDISLEELKKAYHKLALKWHPDKWATKSETERKVAEEKFKEISVAYKEILEERKNKLAVVKANTENAEKNKTETNTDSSEKFNKEEAKKKIEEELKWVDEILEIRNLLRIVSEEILAKMLEISRKHLVYEKDLPNDLISPYKNIFQKLYSLKNKEEIINFKNKFFAAVEEAIKKSEATRTRCHACGRTQNNGWNYCGDFGGIHKDKKFCSWKCAKPFFDKWYQEERLKREKEKSSNSIEPSPKEKPEEKKDEPNQLDDKQEKENFKDQFQNLQNQLNQLQVQIQSIDQSNKFHQIQDQLNALQSQIQGLENQPTTTSRVSASSSNRQKLIELKSQAQRLQKNLQNKNQQEKEIKENISQDTQQPKKEFPWLWVVIPMVVIILIMGIVIFAFWRKRPK